MYFKNLTENIGPVPDYMINDVLAYVDNINVVEDSRTVLGKKNLIQGFAKMDFNVQRTVTQISSYILSQQFPLLKDMVIYESLIVSIPGGNSEIKMPTRYLCRVGELLVVPVRGTLSMFSEEFGQKHEFMLGNIYRVNNRINSVFNSSDDFLAVCFNLLDFDLRRYLMPHDISSPFERRKDEYLTADLAPQEPEVPKDAY